MAFIGTVFEYAGMGSSFNELDGDIAIGTGEYSWGYLFNSVSLQWLPARRAQ